MRLSEIITEAPLPDTWDQTIYSKPASFKERVAYAVSQAQKLGTGSSRVVVNIEYQGRPTALKIAKNNKGLAQNNAEVSILNDGYASKLDILIPLIDYDKEHTEPVWLQTEMATKVTSDSKLAAMIGCKRMFDLYRYLMALKDGDQDAIDNTEERLQMGGCNIDLLQEYGNRIFDLVQNFGLKIGDLDLIANWGIYNGKPVIIDVGFTEATAHLYQRK